MNIPLDINELSAVAQVSGDGIVACPGVAEALPLGKCTGPTREEAS